MVDDIFTALMCVASACAGYVMCRFVFDGSAGDSKRVQGSLLHQSQLAQMACFNLISKCVSFVQPATSCSTSSAAVPDDELDRCYALSCQCNEGWVSEEIDAAISSAIEMQGVPISGVAENWADESRWSAIEKLRALQLQGCA
mmetsp:Transcript_41977/g.91447  ORF Transcript_41977/g.91447 Transcript_41977/m.91447 type:complete len:143 (+) Transcript_41977:233-661(+)